MVLSFRMIHRIFCPPCTTSEDSSFLMSTSLLHCFQENYTRCDSCYLCPSFIITCVLAYCACKPGRWGRGVPGRGSAGWTGAWHPAAGCAGSATAGSSSLTRPWASAMWWFWCCGPRSKICPAGPLASPSWMEGWRGGSEIDCGFQQHLY